MTMKSQKPLLFDDVLTFELLPEKQVKGLYLPIGIFTTSYGREKTIRTSQAITDYSIQKYGIDKYYYSDTDSIHSGLTIEELKQFCDIDQVALGKWRN